MSGLVLATKGKYPNSEIGLFYPHEVESQGGFRFGEDAHHGGQPQQSPLLRWYFGDCHPNHLVYSDKSTGAVIQGHHHPEEAKYPA